MSLSQSLFNEFRPFFNMFDDPFESSLSTRRHHHSDPYNWQATRPALNLSEEEDGSYVVEAEVPGMKKENLDIRIGDGGRSLTIQGHVIGRRSTNRATSPSSTSQSPPTSSKRAETGASNEGQSAALTTTESRNEAGQHTGGWSGARTFTRTVWLPQPVDPKQVKAKLEDGILMIQAKKANLETVSITVD